MTKIINNASGVIAKIERGMLIILAATLTILILLNVVTRAVYYALYWVDELAIYTMIWLVIIGASTTIYTKQGIAVTILKGVVTKKIAKIMDIVVDVIILIFAVTLIALAWIWYDPITIVTVGFDKTQFSQMTFNYIYDEPTLTIGVPKFIVWSIMPITAVTMTIHAVANIIAHKPKGK